jgi:4-hydroxythreonine-4-phosphate dehydrogenase
VARPRVALTVGDPAGIGPEVVERAMADPRVLDVCEPIRFGVSEAEARERFEAGRLSAAAGRAAYDAIVAAVDAARTGEVDAIATAPVNKEAFALAGLPWPGHTDLLAHLCGARRVAMMFHADALRVVLATVHVPLAQVPATLTAARLRDTIELTHESLPRFGWARPRIAVAGLNPHCGEHGLIGHEDEDVIAPTVAGCREAGIDVTGPFPADTVFVRAVRGEFDVVIACYHDQGLVPVKLLAFGESVNVTLGLPIIRTSVDHGTAFDIAGQGRADHGSLVAAVRLAARLAAGAPKE